MSKETKNVIVPKLRFPEFSDNGEWKENTLGEICSNIASGKDKIYENGKYDLYGSTGVIGKTNSYSYDGNYILVARVGANAGLLTKANKKFGVTDNTLVLFLNDSENLDFIFYILEKFGLNKLVFGSGQPLITGGQLKSLIIYSPKPKEQQKIADCLFSSDELITLQNQKLEVLKAHKKGLMQQLFPAEGETVPKRRFKEYEGCGDWVIEQLGEIYSFKTTNSFSREDLNYECGEIKNIHYGDIHTKFSTLFDVSKEKVPFINHSISVKNIDVENYCREGDIIFADASEDLNDVGKSIEIINLNNERLLSGMHTILARQKGSKLVVGFGGHLFKSNALRTQIQREAQGAKVLGISGTRISNIKIYYPEDRKEQQKIADCLSSLDELIQAQSEKIEELKCHKKGLMQGLFPQIT